MSRVLLVAAVVLSGPLAFAQSPVSRWWLDKYLVGLTDPPSSCTEKLGTIYVRTTNGKRWICKGGVWDPMPHYHTAADMTSGVLDPVRLCSGTPTSSTYCRGDGQWAVPPSGGSPTWGSITGPIGDQTDLQSALDAKSSSSHNHSGVYDPAGTASSAVSTHEAASDPHIGYQRESEKNAASGYAGLDGSSKLTGSQQAYGTGANTAAEGNDARLSDSRPPNGIASGDLGGSYPSPTVTQARGLRETAGPTMLTLGAVADGEYLKRSGNSIVGGTPAGGGSGPQIARKSADQANTTTTFADVTGLTFAVSASTTYSIDCHLSYTSAATTTALQIALNGPASPTALRYMVQVATTATATSNSSQSAYDTVLNPGTGAGTTARPARLSGTIEVGGNAGTLALRFRSEVASSAVTIQRGSFCTLQG